VAAFDFLVLSYAFFKTKYRQSYESGSPDESHFWNAIAWTIKMLQSNVYSLYPLSHWRPYAFMQLVELYHEKDRQVMFLNQSFNMRLLDAVNETASIFQYGKKVMDYFVKALTQRKKQSDISDFWINVQETNKDVHYMLQFHNFALWFANRRCTLASTCGITIQGRLDQYWKQSFVQEGESAGSMVSHEIWKQSLLCAERRRTKIIHFQLAPQMLSTSALEQLGEFDLNDDVAWSILKSSRAACGPGTFVLEYYFSERNDLQFVYVMTKVFSQLLPFIVKITSSQFQSFVMKISFQGWKI
jgi:hypothetical protein